MSVPFVFEESPRRGGVVEGLALSSRRTDGRYAYFRTCMRAWTPKVLLRGGLNPDRTEASRSKPSSGVGIDGEGVPSGVRPFRDRRG